MTSPFQTAFGIDASSLGYRPNLRPVPVISPSGGCAPRVPPVRRSFGLCHPQGAAPPECPPFEGPSGCVTLRGLRPPSAPRSKVLRAVSPSGGCAPRVAPVRCSFGLCHPPPAPPPRPPRLELLLAVAPPVRA